MGRTFSPSGFLGPVPGALPQAEMCGPLALQYRLSVTLLHEKGFQSIAGSSRPISTQHCMKNTQLRDLFKAIRRNNVDDVKRLVAEFGLQVLKRRSNFLFPLRFAAQKGRAVIVSALLDFGVDPNQCDSCTSPPIWDAAQAGHAEVVRTLLERGARPDETGCPRETALLMAIGGGHTDVVELLATAGADLQRKNTDGRTPLEYASHEGRPEIFEVLLRGGANCDGARTESLRKAAQERGAERKRIAKWAKDKSGEALFYASADGNITEVQRLLSTGANPNGVTKDKYVALAGAAGWGHIEVVRLLLAAGAEVNLREEDGKTPLYAAVSRGHTEIVELLLAAGADPNLSPRHRTTIEEAVSMGQPSIVRILAKAGAELNGRTAEEVEAAGAAENAEIAGQMRFIVAELSAGIARLTGKVL